ncbi:MAG TPA: hypothetical protein VM778_03850, partial [Gemmatimonadota bacterium]|nr:hypothetical protein [Gemmatimonadota bacterium]
VFEIVREGRGGLVVPYRFVSPGIHTMRVQARVEDSVQEFGPTVVVNDPDAIRLVRSSRIPGNDPLLGGLAIDSELFLSGWTDDRLYRLDPADLAVQEAVEFPPGTRKLEGVAVLESAGLLAVAEESFRIHVLRLQDLRPERVIELGDAAPGGGDLVYLLPLSDGVVANLLGPALVDVQSGNVLRRREIERMVHFQLSSDEELLAVAQNELSEPGASNTVLLLTTSDLSIRWSTDLPVPPWRVAFSPGGDRVYVLAADVTAGHLVFFVLSEAGEILSQTIVEGQAGLPTGAAPVAVSADGRFVAFSTFSGLYVVDTDLHLVRYRSEPLLGCCSVAAGPVGTRFYVAGTGVDSRGVALLEVRED